MATAKQQELLAKLASLNNEIKARQPEIEANTTQLKDASRQINQRIEDRGIKQQLGEEWAQRVENRIIGTAPEDRPVQAQDATTHTQIAIEQRTQPTDEAPAPSPNNN